ncbi:DUF262 domain-containing protein [Treponema primitia]|uniref:DUF262 domain-containing protein n=1 Tax=Treponema primitia TaxID=88058 RepID=UPI003980F531
MKETINGELETAVNMENVSDNDEIEKEEGNDNINAEIPFNPNEISIQIIPRTIGQLIDMLRFDEILIPSYQRIPNLWNNKKKSRFIESLMLNLPIPLFYFDEAEDKKWRVIDGLQRISTLEHFILVGEKEETLTKNKNPLRLSDLEFKREYEGKTWAGLPRSIQRRIETNQVTINLVGKGTPEEVKYNIFSRINQGGLELKPQEIRTALFQGYRIDFLEQLISSETDEGKSFKLATNNSVSSSRQEDLDFATRFISFYIRGYKEYEPDMDSFLTIGTKSIPQNLLEQKKILEKFQGAMNLSFQIFSEDAFRKTERIVIKRINKPLFEVISVCFARLNQDEQRKLLDHKEEFKDLFRKLQRDNDIFFNAITTSTATKDNVKKRHEIFRALAEEYIK